MNLDISADGNRLISTARDNTLRIWNLITGRPDTLRIERLCEEPQWPLDPVNGILAVPTQSTTFRSLTSAVANSWRLLDDSIIASIAFDAPGTVWLLRMRMANSAYGRSNLESSNQSNTLLSRSTT